MDVIIENSILTENNIYEDVTVCTGTNNNMEWNNCIAISNLKIITNSNSFIWEYSIHPDWYKKYQNDNYKIHDNITNTYFKGINSETTLKFEEDDLYFYMINPFVFKNVGHDLSCLLDQMNFLIKNPTIKNIIIVKGYRDTNNFKLCEFLIACHNYNFIEVDFDSTHYFKKMIILKQEIANLYKHPDILSNIITNIRETHMQSMNFVGYENIILMKTTRNKNCFQKNTQHKCENFIQDLEKKNFVNIIPEEINIFTLACILLNAKNIITSDGCISFYNHIFFNKNSKIIYIGTNLLYVDILNVNDNLMHVSKRLSDDSENYNDVQKIIFEFVN